MFFTDEQEKLMDRLNKGLLIDDMSEDDILVARFLGKQGFCLPREDIQKSL